MHFLRVYSCFLLFVVLAYGICVAGCVCVCGHLMTISHQRRQLTSTDSSEDNTSNKTNESEHSDIEETFVTHQHNTPNNESKTEDIERRIKIRCDKVQSKILFMKEDTRQLITQSERNKKFRKFPLAYISWHVRISYNLILFILF